MRYFSVADCGNKHPGKFRESNRDRGDRAGLDDEKKCPTKKETDRRTVGLPQEHILPARAWQHGGQFSATQSAADRH